MMRSMLAPGSPSAATRQLALSVRRLETRTSFTLSPRASFTAVDGRVHGSSARPSSSVSSAEIDVAVRDALELLLSNSGSDLRDPLVDRVDEEEHVVAALLEGLEVRALLDRAPAQAGHVVDVLLRLGHRRDVVA